MSKRSRQAIGKEAEQVDQGTRVVKEMIGGQRTQRHLIGESTDQLLELARVIERDGEEVLDEQQMEELLLDFGVHEDLVGHVRDQGGQVDSGCEPGLAHHTVDLRQRDDILPLEALTSPHAGLIITLQAHLAEMLD
jgi:hypothetical protein